MGVSFCHCRSSYRTKSSSIQLFHWLNIYVTTRFVIALFSFIISLQFSFLVFSSLCFFVFSFLFFFLLSSCFFYLPELHAQLANLRRRKYFKNRRFLRRKQVEKHKHKSTQSLQHRARLAAKNIIRKRSNKSFV